jgi:hypothetical protein
VAGRGCCCLPHFPTGAPRACVHPPATHRASCVAPAWPPLCLACVCVCAVALGQLVPAPGFTYRLTYNCPRLTPYLPLEPLSVDLVLGTGAVANLSSRLDVGTSVVQGTFTLSLDGATWCVWCGVGGGQGVRCVVCGG